MAECFLGVEFQEFGKNHFVSNGSPSRLPKEDGKYELKLFDYRSNEWTVVTIDDYLPCCAGALKAPFSFPNGENCHL